MRFFTATTIAAALLAIGVRGADDISAGAADDLVATLQKSDDFGQLATLLESKPDVVAQIVDSPGPKTFLAPTDDAVKLLVDHKRDTAGHEVNDVSATLLYHVLNGTYDWSNVEHAPMHTVGHSLLTLDRYANLPGGNGQAVIMSQGNKNSDDEDKSQNDEDDDEGDEGDDNDASSVTNIQVGGPLSLIPLLTSRRPLTSGEVTIVPVQGILTLPSNATETMRLAHATNWENFVSFAPQIINRERGSTAFVPTDAAVVAFNASHPKINLTHTDMKDMVLNHIIDRRVLYSPLLRDQGSLISANGIDMTYDAKANTIRVGNSNVARIVQYDVVQQGGVIHMIDAVLATSEADLVRADRAALSAGLAGNSYVAGPVTAENCASTQGKDVPPSPQPKDGSRAPSTPVVNSTLDTFDVTQSGSQTDAVLGAANVDAPPKGGATRGHIIQTGSPDAELQRFSSAPRTYGVSVAVVIISALLTTVLCALDRVPFLVPLTGAY